MVNQPLPYSVLGNPFWEAFSPNIQSTPPLAQLQAVSSCLIACSLEKETDPYLATPSFQVVVEQYGPPETPFLHSPPSATHQTCAPEPFPALLSFSGHTRHLNVFLVMK